MVIALTVWVGGVLAGIVYVCWCLIRAGQAQRKERHLIQGR
jgi:hypothetical protein